MLKVFSILLSFFLLLSCDSGDQSKKTRNLPQSEKNAKPTAPLEGTAEMAGILKAIAKNTTAEQNSYLNNARAEYYKGIVNQQPTEIRARFLYATELLRAGRTEEAIKVIDEMIMMIKKNESPVTPESLRNLKKLLAISHLRLGEQQNCNNNHNDQSCIIPIREKGVHTLTKGSEQGLSLYKKLLEEDPTDMNSVWLLNVAYMTLGKYPDQVPKQYLIPPQSFESVVDIPLFKDIAPGLGIGDNQLSGGVVTEDFDHDGFIDILVSSWGIRDQIKYFRNQGDGTFTDQTISAGLKGIVGGLNMIHGDYNNDGFEDILVLRGAWLHFGEHPNSLLKNNGDGSFTDVTKEAGIYSLHQTQTATWADFNNDGWLDIFIGNETNKNKAHPCELFINQGNGTFKEVAFKSGVDLQVFVKGVTAGDYNNDGLPDLYVSCLKRNNLLLKNLGTNENGVPTFTDVASEAGVTKPESSFPTWFFDYNNDGWQDIFVSGYDLKSYNNLAGIVANHYLGKPFNSQTPRLYQNNGDGTFSDLTEKANLDRPLFTMGCNFGELNNDGYLDFYLGTGEPNYEAIIPNIMFLNNQGKEFIDVSESGGFGHIQKGHAISFCDLDNDGDQDIYAVMGGAYEGDVYPNVMFLNPGNESNWVKLLFEGTESNKVAIGTRYKLMVKSSTEERAIHRVVSTGGSFGSSSLRQEIGIGDADVIKSLEVIWAGSGKRQIFSNLEPGKLYKVVEGKNDVIESSLVSLDFSHASGMEHHH